MRDVDAAYLAGVIDSDGYITINRSVRRGKPYHYPQVGIAGTRREPHDLAARHFGGNVGRYQPKNSAHRAQFQWSRQGQSAVPVIEAVFPYLRIKVSQAVIALDLAQLVMDEAIGRDTGDPFPWFSSDFDPIHVREGMRAEMVDLNQSRKKTAGRTLDGRTWDGYPA